jgi:transposase-like protein
MAIKEAAKENYITGIAQVSIHDVCPECKSSDITYKNGIINPDALQTRWVVCDKCNAEFLDKYYTGKITDNLGKDVTKDFENKKKQYHGSLVFGFDE